MTAVYWADHERLAVALAELADRPQPFPGLRHTSRDPLRLILAPGDAAFDSLTRGRVPHWGAGVALPGARVIVLNVSRGGAPPADVRRVLRHELAHLALGSHARRRVPRWFDEGYAALAAGEWHHGRVLQLNVQVARGRVLPLAQVEQRFRGSRREAEEAYALAASAVQLLHRWGGEGGLDRLMTALGREEFDLALRSAYGIGVEQFDALWQQDVARRYGWLGLLSAAGIVWSVLAVLLVGLLFWRRRRDHARRERLDAEDRIRKLLDDQELPV